MNRAAIQLQSQSSPPQATLLVLAWSLTAVLLAGCREAAPTLGELVDRAADLPGVRASQHSELRAEFRLVEQSHGLPRELNRQPPPAHKNAAVTLAKVLDDAEQVAAINRQAAAFLGAVRSDDDQFLTAESGALAAKWFQWTRQLTEISESPTCDFGLQYERGYFNDLEFLEQAAAASRLLLIAALRAHPDEPDLAVEYFRQAWRWIDRLAAEQHLELRLKAAELRKDALQVAERLAIDPAVTQQQLLELKQCMDASLAQWPTTAATLARERALALATYEAIRLGLIDLLLTDEESRELRTTGVLDALRQTTSDDIDADEAAYLRYMRELIAAADRPFYARRSEVVESDRLLAVHQGDDNYAWFANRLFAENLTLAQAELARDRTCVEGWALALAAAAGSPSPFFKQNPLNGEAYVVQSSEGIVQVQLGDRRSVDPRVAIPVAKRN